jgi:hypothetical protein
MEPLGLKFKSYELTKATNEYILDPYQYKITKFNTSLPNSPMLQQRPVQGGLQYNSVGFDALLPTYTSVKRSENDLTAQDFHRFEANSGFFRPTDSNLWYRGADIIATNTGLGGKALNVQEEQHIIFPEAQRGGINSKQLVKYSMTSTKAPVRGTDWESQNALPVNNNENCKAFSYNARYSPNINQPNPYKFDSNYCRSIGISRPDEGSMPLPPLLMQFN